MIATRVFHPNGDQTTIVEVDNLHPGYNFDCFTWNKIGYGVHDFIATSLPNAIDKAHQVPRKERRP